jgi:hypothetical protein
MHAVCCGAMSSCLLPAACSARSAPPLQRTSGSMMVGTAGSMYMALWPEPELAQVEESEPEGSPERDGSPWWAGSRLMARGTCCQQVAQEDRAGEAAALLWAGACS